MTVIAEVIGVSGYFSDSDTLYILIGWNAINKKVQIWVGRSLGTLSIYGIKNAEKLLQYFSNEIVSLG